MPLVIRYRITDGVNPASEAILTVRGDDGADVPPIVADAYPSVKAATKSVTVDVTKYVQDPDGDANDITIDKVFDGSATASGTSITAVAGAAPRTVSYEVKDAGGATSVGLIHVPAFGPGFPFVRPGASIAVPSSGSRTVSLADVIVDPGGKTVRLTTTDEMRASPADRLKVANKADTSMVLTAGDYQGPGAVTIQVTDGTSLTDPNGHVVDLNIPVQVGASVPVLRCPTDPLVVIEGGSPVNIDVTSVCHVWAADAGTLPTLRYTASWQKAPASVTLSGSGTHSCGSSPIRRPPDTTGTLTVGVDGGAQATLGVVVRAARPPTVQDVHRTTNAGRTVTLDFGTLVTSELSRPVISVINANQRGGGAASTRRSGAKLSITPDASVHGTMTFDVSVTDVSDLARADRIVHATVTLNVLGVPDAPGRPAVGRTTLSKSAQVSWSTPANNGAPIGSFQVAYAGGTQTCAASPCLITGLTNGTTYTFKVRAQNVVGWGKWSPDSPGAMPNAVPGAVTATVDGEPARPHVARQLGAAAERGHTGPQIQRDVERRRSADRGRHHVHRDRPGQRHRLHVQRDRGQPARPRPGRVDRRAVRRGARDATGTDVHLHELGRLVVAIGPGLVADGRPQRPGPDDLHVDAYGWRHEDGLRERDHDLVR